MENQPLLHPASDASLCESRSRSVMAAWRKDLAPCLPARYLLAFLTCLGLVNVYIMRVNLSVALVQMDRDTATITNSSARVFDWTVSQQGWVLSSFFIGYLFLQIPGGWLSQKFGAKWLFGTGVLATSLLTLITPVAADLSVWALIAVRVLEGFFEGVTYPAVHALWGKWAPPLERSRLVSFSYAGTNIGTITAFLFSGLLIEYGFDGGWPSVFYVFGILGIIWFLFWAVLAYSSPATHPRISKAEREYIETSIGDKKDETPVPWFEIITSGPFWGIVVSMFSYSWGLYVTITCLPTFFNQALQLKFGDSIVMNGIYSAIPYALFIIVFMISGIISDFAISFGAPVTVVRIACSNIGLIGSAVFLLVCGYFGNSLFTGVLYITLSVGFMGCAPAGINTNILDIGPRYAGIQMALSNTISTLAGIIGPLVAKAIATEPVYVNNSPAYLSTYKDEWRDVFVLGAEVMIFGAVVHLILGSGKKQAWANGPTWYRNRMKVKENSMCEDDVIQ